MTGVAIFNLAHSFLTILCNNKICSVHLLLSVSSSLCDLSPSWVLSDEVPGCTASSWLIISKPFSSATCWIRASTFKKNRKIRKLVFPKNMRQDPAKCDTHVTGMILMELFSEYVLFFHFRPCDATLGNNLFQVPAYADANVHITHEKTKGKLPLEHHMVWNGKTICTS